MSVVSNIVELRASGNLRCAKCGTKAACGCNAGYIPAGKWAAAVVSAHPEMSTRAIAAEVGVGRMTVQRARQSGVPNGTPAKRTGKDGKSYPAKPKKNPPQNGGNHAPQDDPDEDWAVGSATASPQDYVDAYWMRCNTAFQCAIIPKGWPKRVATQKMVEAAEKVAEAWLKIAQEMKEFVKNMEKSK